MNRFDSDLFNDMVEAMLPTFSDKLALAMVFRVSVDYHAGCDLLNDHPDDIHLSRYIQVVVHRPTNYTKVYARDKDHPRADYPEIWTKVTDHDSCWRSELLSPVDKAVRAMTQQITDTGIPYQRVSEFICFDLFSGKPCYTTIENAERQDTSNVFPRRFKLVIGDTLALHQITPFLRAEVAK